MHSNIGYIATLALNLSLLLPLATNAKVDNYVLVLTNAYWVLTGIWWCMSHTISWIFQILPKLSYLSATSTWTTFAKRRTLYDYRVEASK